MYWGERRIGVVLRLSEEPEAVWEAGFSWQEAALVAEICVWGPSRQDGEKATRKKRKCNTRLDECCENYQRD